MERIKASFLVLDYKKDEETRICLHSIRKHAKIPHKIVYLDNGSNQDYPFQIYKDGLCDVLICKKKGQGGGFGQTDLIRYCDTEYFFFVQNDQILINDITQTKLDNFMGMVDNIFQCLDLNGDQSGGKGIWTDRAHFMKTSLFNSLGPFPNGGPGNDGPEWNEGYLQKVFQEKHYAIGHVHPLFFQDNGKWSVREAGDGIFKHRTDTKQLYVVKQPTTKTEPYPDLTDEEWETVLNGKWLNGDIPFKWKPHSFTFWK